MVTPCTLRPLAQGVELLFSFMYLCVAESFLYLEGTAVSEMVHLMSVPEGGSCCQLPAAVA